MDNEKVLELVDSIEAALRELVEVTGDQHISSFIVNNHFHFYTFGEDGKPIIDIWREGKAQNE